MASVVIIIAIVSSGLIERAEGILCYRCDSVNQGETCEASPASKHIRSYGDEEPCLTFEEVNNQYLALQKELDSDWYYSVLNGDHGLPIQLIRTGLGNNGTALLSGPFVHADRDLACLFVRSIFLHDMDEDSTSRNNPAFALWFRKCVQLPAMEIYPICGDGNIYKGAVELCVCRTDRCNMDKNEDAAETSVMAMAHHISGQSKASFDSLSRFACILNLFLIKLLNLTSDLN